MYMYMYVVSVFSVGLHVVYIPGRHVQGTLYKVQVIYSCLTVFTVYGIHVQCIYRARDVCTARGQYISHAL